MGHRGCIRDHITRERMNTKETIQKPAQDANLAKETADTVCHAKGYVMRGVTITAGALRIDNAIIHCESIGLED